MDTILIATDLSFMKDDVIKTGLNLARKTGAGVDLAVIINKNLDYVPADIGMNFSDQWEARKFLAERELNAIKAANPDIPINVVTCIGTPQQEIIEQAVDTKASMIVIGTHGRGSLTSMFMGGTAQYVVRHSPVPVLVVPFNKGRH